jgi:hypothetical protein
MATYRRLLPRLRIRGAIPLLLIGHFMTLTCLSTGTTAPHFLLDEGEWLVSCSGETPACPLDKMLGGPQSRSKSRENGKILSVIATRFSGLPTSHLVTILTELLVLARVCKCNSSIIHISVCKVWRSHSGGCEDFSLLGCKAV